MENFEETEQIEQEENFPLQPSRKRKYMLIGVIATLTILIGGAGILLLLTQKEAPYQAPEVTDPGIITQNEIAGWQTYRNEEFGFTFEVEYPEWWTVDHHNIFNSNDPYEPSAGGFLKSDVMKAQFQYHAFSSIKSKQELLDMLVKNQDVLKEGSRPSPFGPIDTESFTSVTNDYGLEIIKFTQSYAYASQIGYIIPGKPDFSEMIYVVVWNSDPLFENVLSTFRFIEEANTEKTGCEESGGMYLGCPTNPSPNAGLCFPCECPQGSWSLTEQVCIGLCPGEFCDLDKTIPY